MGENIITINGETIKFHPGDTVLDAATRHGIDIPTLCYLKRATPTGACRVCLVEVEGARALMPSCGLEAAPGMVIQTESEKVVKSRKMIIEFMLSDGWHDCLICEQSGACKLQELAYRYSVGMPRFSRQKKNFVYDESHPLIVRNFGKCILCGRCVQACNEIQVNNVLSMGYRGNDSTVVASFNKPLGESECVACGECVQACPVGALIEKKPIGKARNWETTKIRTTCPYCGVGCQMNLHVKDNIIIKVTGVEDARPNEGNLCVKGRFGYDFVNHPDRLTTPLIKQSDGTFKKAFWDEALDLVVERLSDIKAKQGANAIAGIGSSRASNEDNYAIMKFMRTVIGTNNIDNCART
jgi:predicted molibdopterin-dependent oxidoreductase YjgC